MPQCRARRGRPRGGLRTAAAARHGADLKLGPRSRRVRVTLAEAALLNLKALALEATGGPVAGLLSSQERSPYFKFQVASSSRPGCLSRLLASARLLLWHSGLESTRAIRSAILPETGQSHYRPGISTETVAGSRDLRRRKDSASTSRSDVPMHLGFGVEVVRRVARDDTWHLSARS